MLDAKTKKVLRVNRAYEAITGRSCQSLELDPSPMTMRSIPKIALASLAGWKRPLTQDSLMKDFASCRPTRKCDGYHAGVPDTKL